MPHHEDPHELVAFVNWSAFNVVAFVGNIPWVPILSACVYIAPRVLGSAGSLASAWVRNRKLARELVAARLDLEKAKAELLALRVLYVDGSSAVALTVAPAPPPQTPAPTP